jgi:hypothetical protein
MNAVVDLNIGRLERGVQEETGWGVRYDLVDHNQ